jgi:hypothetical protein
MRELKGKGWRVLGYFVWMLGAGVYLDSDALGAAAVLMAAGATAFFLGVVQSTAGSGGASR